MREQPGFGVNGRRDIVEIIRRRGITHRCECFTGGPVAQFRLFAERKQRFLAPEGGGVARRFQYLFECQIGGDNLLRRLCKRAVMADIAAQVG